MHTLTLIFSLLLTLMLLWHISTITLIENYDMPKWWEKVFLDEHTKGWKIGIWVGVGLLVSLLDGSGRRVGKGASRRERIGMEKGSGTG
jgi:hypothetical protein